MSCITEEDDALLRAIHTNARGLGECNDAVDRGYEQWARDNGPKFRAAIDDAISRLSAPLQATPEFQASDRQRWTTLVYAVARLRLPPSDLPILRAIREKMRPLDESEEDAVWTNARAEVRALLRELTVDTQMKLRTIDDWTWLGPEHKRVGNEIDVLYRMGIG